MPRPCEDSPVRAQAHYDLIKLALTELIKLAPQGSKDNAELLAMMVAQHVDQAMALMRDSAFESGRRAVEANAQAREVLAQADAEAEAAYQDLEQSMEATLEAFMATNPRVLH